MTDTIRHEDALRIAVAEAKNSGFVSPVVNAALVAAVEALLAECQVLNHQDMAWGECRGHMADGLPGKLGPHEISTSLCVYCLEYDPE